MFRIEIISVQGNKDFQYADNYEAAIEYASRNACVEDVSQVMVFQ